MAVVLKQSIPNCSYSDEWGDHETIAQQHSQILISLKSNYWNVFTLQKTEEAPPPLANPSELSRYQVGR